jgi:uncharacterized membrane protein YfcA
LPFAIASVPSAWPKADCFAASAPTQQRSVDTPKGWLRSAATPLARLLLSAAGMATMLPFAFEHSPSILPAAMAIVFAAAALSSIGGFAFSALCGALLFHVMAPVSAVQLMIVCSIAIQTLSVVALRNAIDWSLLARFLLGGVVGLPLGVYLLLHLDAAVYKLTLGGLLVAYGAFMLVRPAATVRWRSASIDVSAGLLGGITGGFAGFPGAFVTIWCALQGEAKDRQRGVYQPFILIMQILALAAISGAAPGPRLIAFSHGLSALFYVPAALLGTWCGLGWYSRLSDAQFRTIVNLLLIASGVALAL